MRLVIAVFCLALVVVAFAVGMPGCKEKRTDSPRVMVLGCDGMDPRLLRRLIDDGRMPNFAKLERQGGLRNLETSIPPQSPVAWSNFITGAGPGVHGIFDFVHRDPAQQAEPYFSTNRVVSHDLRDPISIPGTKYVVPHPLNDVENQLLRRGIPFWDYLDEEGIPVKMYRLPANFPPSKSKHGHMCCLSGMGVPDVFASQGTYQHFTTRPRAESRPGGGMKFRIRKDYKSGAYIAKLHGPPNDYRPVSKRTGQPPEMIIEMRIYPDKENEVAKIIFSNAGMVGLPDDTVELVLNVGEWSKWTEVHFLNTPVGPSFGAMGRFYLQSVSPDISLYVTPLNFIPTNTATPFSEPAEFAEEIGEQIGPFYTQGFAEDFKARDTGVFNDAEYKVQADMVLDERFKLLDYALNDYEEGLLFFYFSSSDLQAHIFYWDSDDPHPVRTPEEARKYMRAVEDIYVRLDGALGKCMEKFQDGTIIVMSDHGFRNFKWGFGLNRWLRDEGYLVTETDVLMATADEWLQSRAYGMGLNGLYLNLRGREKYGIVSPAERDRLVAEITERLLAYRDPDTDRPVVKYVYDTAEWYKGPEQKNAPDMIVGYHRNYRASWATTIGGIDKQMVSDNKMAWSADHCIAHDEVPGILLCNKKIEREDPALIDVAPTILNLFGVSTPDVMAGRSFLGEAR